MPKVCTYNWKINEIANLFRNEIYYWWDSCLFIFPATVLSPGFPLQTSDVACIDINKNDMWFVGNTIERSWYKLGNATAECYKNSGVRSFLREY